MQAKFLCPPQLCVDIRFCRRSDCRRSDCASIQCFTLRLHPCTHAHIRPYTLAPMRCEKSPHFSHSRGGLQIRNHEPNQYGDSSQFTFYWKCGACPMAHAPILPCSHATKVHVLMPPGSSAQPAGDKTCVPQSTQSSGGHKIWLAWRAACMSLDH